MCILFLHTNLKPIRGGYRLILAANRDEAYKRPALPAHFWTEDPNVIGGRDMEPGREGGSWLALSKSGRIAGLLNVLHLQADAAQVLGRGNLVNDFVLGRADTTAKQYTARLAGEGSKYNQFNLVAIQIGVDSLNVSACSNANAEPISLELGAGTLGFGNSLIGRPFNKVSAGTQRFQQIVGEHETSETKEALTEKLVELLRWDQRHLPDAEMEHRGSHLPVERLEKLSSVFVKLSSYGTRTHTVVLIDDSNNVSYIEWTMLEPIDPENPTWTKLEKNFKLAL